MKPKLGIHAYDISLYKSCVFYPGRIRTLVAMATYSSHRLIMGIRRLKVTYMFMALTNSLVVLFIAVLLHIF